MQFSTISYEVDGQIARLTLQRPEVSNGFNIPMCEEILAAIEATKQNDEVVILSKMMKLLFFRFKQQDQFSQLVGTWLK